MNGPEGQTNVLRKELDRKPQNIMPTALAVAGQAQSILTQSVQTLIFTSCYQIPAITIWL